jgi:hypothetical protein
MIIFWMLVGPSRLAFGQYVMDRYYPDIRIDSIFIEPDGIGITSKNQAFLYDGASLNKTSLPETVHGLPTFYFPDSTITAYSKYKNGFLLSISGRLYFFDGSQLRQFSIPLNGRLQDITAICSCKEDFAVLADGELQVWNQENYAFANVPAPAKLTHLAKKCDTWGGFWVANATDLFGVIKENNNALPGIVVSMAEPFATASKNIKLEGQKNVSFVIKANHTRLKKLKLEYQFEGDDQWSIAKNNTPFQLDLKAAKSYTLICRATVDDQYYAYADEVRFSTVSTGSLSWLWYLLLVPISILVTAVWFSHREKQFKRELEKEKEKYRLQAEAKDWEDQALRLKMNPHFIFNTLAGIQGLIAIGDQLEARGALQKFSAIMRFTLKQANNKFITVEEEISFLNNYLSLEKITRNKSFDFEVSNEAEDDLMIPPMLVQPLVENAIIHGFKGITYRGLVQVRFYNDDLNLYCSVTDNGVGIKASSENTRSESHNGIALATIKKRLTSLHKFKKGKLEVEDLTDKDGNISGTRFTITIPL